MHLIVIGHMARLRDEVNERRARLVILDITGVSTVDSAVAHALLRTIRAVGLLGCNVTL